MRRNEKTYFVMIVNTLLRLTALTCVLFFCSFFNVEASVLIPPTAGSDTLELTITIEDPAVWVNEKIDIAVKAEVSNNEDYVTKVEAKTEKSGTWQDITNEMQITIYENCTVYVQVTDNKGNIYLKNRYIECFDREAPAVRAWSETDLLNVEAYDDLSGVAAIHINGNEVPVDECTDPIHGTTEVLLQNYIDPNTETIDIQAVDKAGNMSSVYSVKNIGYNETSVNSGVQSIQNNNTNASVTPTDGSGTVLENSVKTPEEREFYTIETKKGNIFYIMIDKQKPSDNVYLLVEADERDLSGFVDTNEQADGEKSADEDKTSESSNQPSIIERLKPSSASEPTEPDADSTEKPEKSETNSANEPEATPDSKEESQPKKSSNIGSVILLLLVLIGVGGAGYYFKIYKPKKQLDDAEDYDSFNFVSSDKTNSYEDDEPDDYEDDEPDEIEDDGEGSEDVEYEDDEFEKIEDDEEDVEYDEEPEIE